MGDNLQDQLGVAPGPDEPQEDEDQFICQRTNTRRWKPSPATSSRQEIAEHRIDHWPFRSWCADCVAGKATADHHRVTSGKDDDESRVPILAFEYAFMSNTGDTIVDEEVSEAKVLVGRDSKSKYVFSIPVPQKGIDDTEWSVRTMVQAIDFLGYKEIILKVGQESSLNAVVDKVRMFKRK